MKNLISFNNFFYTFLTLLVLINFVNSLQLLCADIKCEKPISSAFAVQSYSPPTKRLIALRINSAVKVFSKPVVSGKDDVWQIETQGNRGFAPKRFLKEDKIFVTKENLLTVEFNDEQSKPEEVLNKNEPEIKSSEYISSETTTTKPLNVDEVPKAIVEQAQQNIKPEENVQSSVVQNDKIVERTTVLSNAENLDDDKDIDGKVEEDEEYDPEDYGEEYTEDEEDEDDDDDNTNNDKNMEEIKTKHNDKIPISQDGTIVVEKTSNKNLSADDNTNQSQNYENKDKEQKLVETSNTSIEVEKTENKKSENTFKTDNLAIDNKLAEAPKQSDTNFKPDQPANVPELSNENKNINENTQTPEKIQNINLIPEEVPQLENANVQLENLNNEIEISQSLPRNEEIILDTNKVNVMSPENINVLEQPKIEENSQPQTVQTPPENEQSENNANNPQLDSKDAEAIGSSGVIEPVLPPEHFVNPNEVHTVLNDNPRDDFTQNLNQNNENVVFDNDKLVNQSENSKEKPLDSISTENNYEKMPNEKPQEATQHQTGDAGEHLHQHHHHNHRDLPPMFNRYQVPVVDEDNTNNKLNNFERNENNIPETNRYEEINKQSESTVTEQKDEQIFENKIGNENVANLDIQKDSLPFDDSTSTTTIGHIEDNNVDSPIEETTPNPQESKSVDAGLSQSVEGENLEENDSQTEKKSESTETLTQESVTNSQADVQIEESADSSDMYNIAIDFFNVWTGRFFDTLNGFWISANENVENVAEHSEQTIGSSDLSEDITEKEIKSNIVMNEEYCEKIGPNDNCPKTTPDVAKHHSFSSSTSYPESDFFTSVSDKILEMFDMLVLLCIAAVSSIIFAFGYYCISNSRKENFLINKLNIVERNLMAANKEVNILKQDLQDSRSKVISMEDSSYGTNDLVAGMKNELDSEKKEKDKLKTEIISLESELKIANDANVELNKVIADYASKEKYQEILVNKLEELEEQITDHENTIADLKQTLNTKTNEINELHLTLSEKKEQLETQIIELQNKVQDFESEKIILQSKFDESEKVIKVKMQSEIEVKTEEIKKLQNEIKELKNNFEDIDRKKQTYESKIESLKEVIRNMNKESWADIDDLIETVDIKADNLLLEKENSTLKERLEGEKNARKLLEDHVKVISEEVATLKKEHNQAEKDKLEAETRLDVLSNYFKEKEAQLQKDLTVKEALWLQQQGETTNTVERIRAMQEEIQTLKSQNVSLHAEIEAQTAAHKTQLAALETTNHETWLLSKQAERKCEEARSESAILRRKLTSLVATNNNYINNNQSGSSNNLGPTNDINHGIANNSVNNVPSPIHLDSPNSPSMIAQGMPPAGLPPPPPFLPPHFMPPLPPGPFMGMPPPFMGLPPGGRPPPLGGRLISPPPLRRGRYSPSLIDDDDDDYYDDHDDYNDNRSQRRGRNTRSYSPENGRYSPDSRYNYTTDVMSQYDTETDFSPQVSPRGEESYLRGRRGGSINRDLRQIQDRSTPIERANSSNSKSFKALSPSPQKNNSISDNRSNKSSNKGSSSSYSSCSLSTASSSSSSSLDDAW